METVLDAFMDDLRRHLDWGGLEVLQLLDMSMTFDIVDHQLLSHHLVNAKIQGSALYWLSSFLQGQEQRVALGEQ